MFLINGHPAETVDARDRGLHYGDGLFETTVVVDGKPLLWDLHLERLARGCGRLGIPMPASALLRQEALRAAAGSRRGVLKLIVTRGSGGRGYRAPEPAAPTRILALHPWPDHPRSWWHEGVRVRLCRTPLGCHPLLGGIKHLNRLEQVMARAEWSDPAVAEGLMCDLEGRVVEGVMSNLFAVREGRLATPPLGHCGVEGVMRRRVLELADGLGIAAEERHLTVKELHIADELFLTNSVIGIWPVAALDSFPYGQLRPVTRSLQAEVAALGFPGAGG